MEPIIQILIIIHAILGTIALISGLIAIITRKGSKVHKQGGICFVYSMFLSGAVAIFVSVLPGHENPFLFSIGIFSIYFLLIGYRATKFKNPNHKLTFETRISQLMFLVCSAMIIMPIINSFSLNIVSTVFGVFASLSNILQFRNIEDTKKKWLSIHLGNITGAYISAVTAFMVVNQLLPGTLNWFAPSVPGAIFIIYWLRKAAKPA